MKIFLLTDESLMSFFSFLLIALNFSYAELNCNSYEINEKRVFQGPTENKINYRAYSVKKTSQNEYELGFNPVFSGKNIQKRFQNCFKNGYFLKTNSNKVINIVEDTTAPTAEILIVDKRIIKRNKWHSRISCQLMAHEILHWAGLCDEYKTSMNPKREYVSKDKPSQFPCRRVRYNNFMATYASKYSNTLLDDQLNQILYPNCFVNSMYVKCSKYAYERGEAENSCSLPKECSQVFLNEPLSNNRKPTTKKTFKYQELPNIPIERIIE